MNAYAITKDNLPSFAYTNEKIVSLPIRSVVLDFHGLNMNQMLSDHSERSVFYAQNGVLHVIPYDNPWSWMNDTAVQMTDCIVDAVYARLGLSPAVPLISTGGSMGGLSALSYTVRTRHKVAACAANCPVCDLVFHYTERPDLRARMRQSKSCACRLCTAWTIFRTSPITSCMARPIRP